MKIHRLYADKNGESHFQDVEVEYAETTRAGRLSKRIPATGIIFREVQPDYDLDWHPAPRRQYIINLDAGVQITASDGEARRIGAGEILLVEDTHGKGHLSKAIEACATASSSHWSEDERARQERNPAKRRFGDEAVDDTHRIHTEPSATGPS